MTRAIFQFLTLAAVAVQFIAASPAPATLVTLVDPIGFEPVPITASIVGTDAQGRTTYDYTLATTTANALATLKVTEHGTPLNPSLSWHNCNYPPVTLVEASNYFSITDVIDGLGTALTVGAECELGTAKAVCTVTGPQINGVVTETSMGTLVLDIPSPTDRPSSAQRTSRSIVVAFVFITLSLTRQLV
ncbi:hypothetical protein B0H12DRAFT_1237728 [Mycena haematopus]|nr:hypothetical protein B0H12DRAFT_1237728 [Mycena haematopus]